ncbi:MAG: transposase [Bacteroidia bacterium]|nr:transposase [Bacteroidia bacterium]
MLTYKRKLILNKAQQARIDSWIGACRVVYNLGLEVRKEAWKNKQQQVHKFELMKQLTEIRDIDWIKDAPIGCLQNSIERLDNSYKNFFKGNGFPKWANKKKYKSISLSQDNNNTLRVNGNVINIHKIKKVRFFKDSFISGNIKKVTIIKEPTGYFINITTDAVKSIQNQDESQILGIDMGVAVFATDSNGGQIQNPKHFKKHERQLRIENRSLARKKKGSNRWGKQVKRLALLHHKIGNVRKDFLHKESTKIAVRYSTVYLEDLNIKGMSKGRLSKHILDAGWGMFRTMLEYKTNVVAINPKFTSQTCNDCGVKDAKSRISQSKFVCTSCGVESNADVNAAKNIMDKGIVLNRQRKAVA